ncbi:MAG TPA: proline dehydrogenase family protein [Candidatus Binatia bacterium]|nr:proline dehydrogenase family protein [Candidatus Binatia bacterium]
MGGLGEIPERALRSLLLTLSRRRAIGALATHLPITRAMVARFVAGADLAEALEVIAGLRERGLRWTVDVLGEAVTSVELAAAAADRYVRTIDALAERGLEVNVSLKLSQMGLLVDRAACRANVERIFAAAAARGGFVRIDMEDHTMVEATLALWRELRPHNPSSGVVIQAALRRSAADVEALIAEGARVRLCKGAYKEPPSVAFVTKAEVDRSFAALMERLLLAGTYPAIATHDIRLIRRAIAIAREHGIGPERFEFQMLYGVRRDLQERLVREGWRVRVYVPYGTEWYPYFMRRLAERPANVLFLLRSLAGEARADLRRRGRPG